MKETLKLTAPLERIFRSIEGESSRIGEVTSFLKLGDGPYTRVDDSLAKLVALGPAQTFVIQTSNVTHLDWRHFVEEWVCLALQQDVKVIHETRGELDGPRVQTYLWLTPGVTILKPADLHRDTDEVKLLVNEVHEIRAAIKLLDSWANYGIPCFIFPRVQVGQHAPFFEAFLRMNPPRNIRMMLLEHEVIGID